MSRSCPGPPCRIRSRRLAFLPAWLLVAFALLPVVACAAGATDSRVLEARATESLRIPVIVDTDVALDDVRSLALLTSDPRIDLRAVVTSDGSSAPATGARNIARVLRYLDRADVPVAAGDTLGLPAPAWRAMSEALGGAELPSPGRKPGADAAALVRRALGAEPQRTTYLCLGPLTNLARALGDDAAIAAKIAAVYYWGTPPWETELSWNTERDTTAARIVFESGVTVYAIYLDGPRQLTFDRPLYDDICKLPARGAKLIDLLHRAPTSRAFLNRGHFRAWDETVVLCLLDPAVIELTASERRPSVYLVSAWQPLVARQAYVETLARAR
jgi:inosine-uridine nucleoside N-ribohydrolase